MTPQAAFSRPTAPEARGYRELLRLLDDDAHQAERSYRRLRERLIQLFVWRGCTFPEDLADETLSRVARRVGEGVEIRAEDPFRFCCGVAFRVFQESLREQAKLRRHAESSRESLTVPAFELDEPDERQGCLRRCLAQMQARSRELIVRYYEQGETGTHIASRQRLAEELGIPSAALRSRARRIRARLEECLAACMRRSEALA